MKTRQIIVLFAALIICAGCGRKETSHDTASDAAAGKSGAEAGVRTVEVTGNDQMKFNLTRIEARAGERLRVRFANVGMLPKAAMGHNWVLLQADASVDEFVKAAATAAQTDYIPADAAGQVIAHTKLLGPGEKEEVTFVVPASGEYPFICSFPGHAMVGMKGVLVVK